MSARIKNLNPIVRKLALLAAVGSLAALVAPASAQRYQRNDGMPGAFETPYDIQQTRDGGCVVVGEVGDADGRDMYVSRHDVQGNVLWTLRYGTPDRDAAFSVQETMNGEFIVAGHTEDGPLGLALLLVDPLGNPIWAHTYRADVFGEILLPAIDGVPPQVAVRESFTGDFIAVANMRNDLGGQVGIFLRTDPLGMPMVNVAYHDRFTGDFTFEGFSDLKETPDGSIVITGFKTAVFDPPNFFGSFDILTMRIGPFGMPGWAYQYGDQDQTLDEAGRGIDFDPMTGEIIVGAAIVAPDGNFATEHLWMDGAGGGAGLLLNHVTMNMLPAYSATRMYHGVEVATAGRDYGLGGSGIASSAAVVTLPPMIPGVLDLWVYGPGIPLGAEGLTPMDQTCGYAITGFWPEIDGGQDQWIAKSNDAGDTGCFQERVLPIEHLPPIDFFPLEFEPDLDEQWEPWGQPLGYQSVPFIWCHIPLCDCLVDLNGDGIVDAGDLGLFITYYMAGNLLVDFTGDGIVDAGDLSYFITHYLAGC